MQINRFSVDPATAASGVATLPAAALGPATLLRDPSSSAGLDEQLSAYQDLSSQWRGSRNLGERAALAHVLSSSAFGQRVDDAVNRFTKAAWAGTQAAPPEPQVKMLQAFDSLSADDQTIVSALQTDPATGANFASPEAMRAHLHDQIVAAAGRKPDQVTLSSEAKARLAEPTGDQQSETPAIEPANPLLARVLVAYAKAYTSTDQS